MATSRTPLYGAGKSDVPELAKCYVCDLVTEDLCERNRDQREHRELIACLLYELHQQERYYLCERCRVWLCDITYSLQMVQGARTFSEVDPAWGCFMCGDVVRIGIFTMNVETVEKIVLDRFAMHYGSITKSMAMICTPCARTFRDLVRLHTVAGTEMRSKQIPAAVPFYVDNYEDLRNLEVTPTPSTSSAHMEFKPCHHTIPPTPTTGQHFSICEYEKESISAQTGPTEPSTGNAVVAAQKSEPYSDEQLEELKAQFGLLMNDDDPSGQQSTKTGSKTGESSSDQKEELTCDDPPVRES